VSTKSTVVQLQLTKLRERLSQVKKKKGFDGVQRFLSYTKLRDLENLPVKSAGHRLKKVITPESRRYRFALCRRNIFFLFNMFGTLV
jgi:hypothetical protein